MISKEHVQSLQHCTCAIGYVTIPLENFVHDISQPYFKVIGTGFLIDDDRIMTNRHVIQGLLHEQANYGFPNEQRVLMFVQPSKPGRWKIHVTGIIDWGFIRNANVDVGFIKFLRPDAQEFDDIKPPLFQKSMSFSVAEPVAICGFPFGHSMLQKDTKVYRWGPVLQQGYISAISPFDNTNEPDELLLDIRIAPGMSGSAVCRSSDGSIIGIVHSTWEYTTAVALPLDTLTIDKMIHDYDVQRHQRPNPSSS